MIEALAILGVLLALALAAKCQRDADERYARGMDEYRIMMRRIHGLPGENLSPQERHRRYREYMDELNGGTK